MQGDAGAASDLSGLIWIRACRVGTAVLRNRDAAEDVAQSTYLRVLPYWPHFTHDAQFKRFVDVTARNRALDEVRKRRRWADHPSQTEGRDSDSDPADPASSPFDTASRNEIARLLVPCVGQLGDTGRQIVLLRLSGYSNIEIAQILGTSNRQVATFYDRAVRKLRRCMEDGGFVAGSDVMEVQ